MYTCIWNISGPWHKDLGRTHLAQPFQTCFFFFKGNQNSKYTVLIISYKKALIGKIDFFFFHCWKQEKRLSRILLNSASMPRWSGWPPNSPKEIKHVKRPPSTRWSLLLRSYKPAYRTWRATCSKATRTFDSENPDWLSPIRRLRISLVMEGIEKKKTRELGEFGAEFSLLFMSFFPKIWWFLKRSIVQ